MVSCELNGLLLVDKPSGCTSHDVVSLARKILNTRTVGHSGTLDPLASGLLVLLIGDGTKLSDYILGDNKRYRVRMQLGVTTDTLDRTGQILTQTDFSLSEEQLRQAVLSHVGEFEWSVPHFSAVKIKGQKLYEYARQNKAVEAPVRKMVFYDLEIRSLAPECFEVDISCTKGSYVRTWVDQVGRALGCGAVVDQLRRIRSEPFSVDDSVQLEALQKRKEADPVSFFENLKTQERAFVPMSAALPKMKACLVLEQEQKLLRNGQIPKSMAARLVPDIRESMVSERTQYMRAIGQDGDLLALLELGQQGVKIRRVFLDMF